MKGVVKEAGKLSAVIEEVISIVKSFKSMRFCERPINDASIEGTFI